MPKTPVDYSVLIPSGLRVLVHSKSNYIMDICDAIEASGIDAKTVLEIDPILS
jgi:hypothetical protein